MLRDELTRRAYLALRSAKQRGPGSVVCYAPEMEAELKERRFVKREIARALAARAFEVHYQPIVRAEDGAVTGVEALLRWHHPTRGFVPPSLFVPVAEEAGLMQGLGELVLRRAIADATRWPQLYVSVNLSPVQVRDRAFVKPACRGPERNGIRTLAARARNDGVRADPQSGRNAGAAHGAAGTRRAARA